MNPYLGEIKAFAFGNIPSGWALCDGRLLYIATNQALFAVLGTMYGGDGMNNFALPNLQGKVPLGMSAIYSQGTTGGEEFHVLSPQETPQHSHAVICSDQAVSDPTMDNEFWGVQTNNVYSNTPNTVMASQSIGYTGGSGHENRSPFLVFNICIAIQGVFPPR